MTSLHPISNKCVEQAWQDIGGKVAPAEIEALSRRFATSQEALAAYILACTEELSQNAHELAYYSGLVIWQCYERSLAGPLRKITSDDVTRHHEALERQLLALQGVDDRIIERRILHSDDYPQPALLKYMVEVIYESAADAGELTPDEQGELFICLRVVTDALESAAKPKP
jgi:hypothetical protein